LPFSQDDRLAGSVGMTNSKRLTPRQERFVREYIRDLNGSRAAIAAGYSKNGAKVTASRLLTNVNVSSEIAKLTQKACEKLEISADYVLRNIRDTIERCSQAEPVLDREGKPTGEYKFDSCAVLKGCELLGKHLKLFTDKVEFVEAEVDLSRLTDDQLHEIERIIESATDPNAK
jgi:phage terminase small subunit